MSDTKRSSFSGRLGFVLAAAGSAVGLGNIWRFPYLAAKYGGGMFLLVYIVFAVTFGFTLMVTEIAIGRKTKLSPMSAFGALSKKWNWLGGLATLVPVLILPYYCLIGGWVTKYAAQMIAGKVDEAAAAGFFGQFVSKPVEPLIWFFIFATATTVIILLGVDKGIEKMSKFLMPALVVLTVALSIFVVTRPGAKAGVEYYLKPDFSKLSVMTFIAALGQMFYSMSLAMGIMVTYGSYLNKDESIVKSTRQIEIFDTAVAFLAGLMIVPSVFVYSGGDEAALGQGPSLMFDTLPKVFAGMEIGNFIGAAFFLLVLFAALTSSVSVMEAIVAGITDKYKMERKRATLLVYAYTLLLGMCCAFGFSIWQNFTIMNMGILDFLDFVSNSILLPVVGLFTCIMVGFAIKPKTITDEIELNGKFKEKKFYNVMIKWIAPVFIFAILVSSVLNTFGVISI